MTESPLSEKPLFVIASRISLWRNRRFVRWADVMPAVVSAIFAMVIASSLIIYLSLVYSGSIPSDSRLIVPWGAFVLAGTFFLTAYFVLFVPSQYFWEQTVIERRTRITEAAGQNASLVVLNPSMSQRCMIAKESLLVDSRRPLDVRAVVCRYDMLHVEKGLATHRASLILQDQRSYEYSQSPRFEDLIDGACSDAVLGEVESVTLPIRARMGGLVLPMMFAPVVLTQLFRNGFSGLFLDSTASKLPSNVALMSAMFGMVSVGVLILGYTSLRELGLFPLPLFRGECSAEKTRVFHRFRWKTFTPGRDLAILRFTSNQEADIAFLGVDGHHATARVGGKYLDHFIACWASPR